jgi:menaquinone-specific isochorismate synthase
MTLMLGNLQSEIINGLIKGDFESNLMESGPHYITLGYDINVRNLSGLMNHFHPTKKFYFKSKDKSTEFLALGEIETFKNLYDYEKIECLVKKHKFLKIVGGQRFQQEDHTLEWHGIEDCLFVVPQVIIEKNKEGAKLYLFLKSENMESEEKKKLCLHNIATTLDPKNHNHYDHNNYVVAKNSYPEKKEWDNIVKDSLKLIHQNIVSKIVLSRKFVAKYKKNICGEDIFDEIKDETGTESYNIFFQFSSYQTFVCFTPETLFSLNKDRLKLDALAGTTSRAKDAFQDNELGIKLLTNKKEIQEHRYVTNFIKDKMESIVDEVEYSKKEELLKLGHVQHIHSVLEGRLKKDTHFIDLFATFHPTPAVGGTPRTKALELIKELEPYTRGFYAAPVGYFSQEKSEFAVGIRSALIHNEKMHVYGGCGIVDGSLPDLEWQETKNKMKNFKNVLGAKV